MVSTQKTGLLLHVTQMPVTEKYVVIVAPEKLWRASINGNNKRCLKMRKANTIAFVENAGEAPGNYPWENDRVRSDVWKPVIFRLSEPEYLKLKHVCEQDRVSMQELLRKSATSVVNNRLSELLRPQT